MPTDAELLMRAINAPPVLGELSAATAVPYTDAYSFAGPGKQLAIKDAQGIANAVAAWRRVANQAPTNRFAGVVFGDTPGGAQSQLLNLRGQNIAIAENAARMQQARELAAQQNARMRESAALENQRLAAYNANRLAQDAALTRETIAQRRQGDILDYLSKLNTESAKAQKSQAEEQALAEAWNRVSQLQSLAPVFNDKFANLDTRELAILQQLRKSAENAYYNDPSINLPQGTTIEYDDRGIPSLRFPSNLPAESLSPTALQNFDAAVWGPQGEVRRDLNNLALERNRLERGQAQYDQDLALARAGLTYPQVRTPEPASLPIAEAAQILLGQRAKPQAAKRWTVDLTDPNRIY